MITYDPDALFRSRYNFPLLESAARQRSQVYSRARLQTAQLIENANLLKLPQVSPRYPPVAELVVDNTGKVTVSV